MQDQPITSEDLDQARTLIADWMKNRRDPNWMDKFLTPDFRFSSFLLPRVLHKEQFIEIVSNTPADLEVVSVGAEAVGKIILGRLLLDVIDETFVGDMGPGMPTGKDVEDAIVGHKVVYLASMRRSQSGWKCFDYHQIAVVD